MEPEVGWVDTVSAGGALFLRGGLGFVPVQPGNPELVGDQIPVDLVVNCILAAGLVSVEVYYLKLLTKALCLSTSSSTASLPQV
jgi:hypothetical protein